MASNLTRSGLALALALLVAAPAGPALAASETFKIDNTHSRVGFSVRHFFTQQKGKFNQVQGTIVVDQGNLNNTKVEVTIPAASINTDHERRDTHLKSADFFDVEKYPEITFVSTAVDVGKDNKGTMTGNLTMKGVTKPVTLDVEVLGFMEAGPQKIAGFTGRGKIDRKDFNILWNRTFDQGGAMLSDDVAIELEIEAKTPPPPAENAAAGAKTN